MFGLVSTKPLEDKVLSQKTAHDISTEEAFRKAEMTLHRYFYLINSETDQLVHALLHVLMNNPRSFPFVSHHALDIAFKNLAKKLGQDDVDILSKSILSSIEQNSQAKSKQTSSFQLPDEVKEKIENALDKFFHEPENNSHL